MILSETFSVCPVCLKRIKAAYVKRGNVVYFEKSCEEHGAFSCAAANDAQDFENWYTDTVNIRPKTGGRAARGCPYDCGPCENHLQTACCVLIDITDRCNQHCAVCFASASNPDAKQAAPAPPGAAIETPTVPTTDISIAEIEQKYDELIRMSEERKFNIQLSGGEPTVREDLHEIIKMAKNKGFEYVQLNTNGKRIGQQPGYAQKLKQAGLDTVFMQFDSMNDAVYEKLRGEKLLEIKKKAVQNCRDARIPVALVPTLICGINDNEIGGMFHFMLENLDVVKGIHFQPVSFFGRYPAALGASGRFTMFDTINEIARQTDDKISKKDMLPISTGHNLCCFYASYLRQEDESILCTSAEKRKADECGCCLPDIEIISKDRDFVLSRWKMAENVSEDGFDEFLNHIRANSFTITGMAFQDALSLDTERLTRCRVQVLSETNRLIPFCAYNLTDTDGYYLYRK